MGTKEKGLWIPTDANMQVVISDYEDLEDGGTYSELAYQIASENLPDDSRRERLEEHLRAAIRESIDSDVSGDIQSIEYEFQWHIRHIEVCEWCESPQCDGDGCSEEPDWCDGCESYSNGKCDCVWCDECEIYNCEVDHSQPRPLEHKNTIYVTDLPVNEDEPDVESLL
jgi:hypothetical protein